MIDKLLGATAVPAIEAIGNIVDEVFTSKEEKLSAEQLKLALLQKPQLAQVELSKIEAAHRSIFVAGWRPACGWVCALSLLYTFILYDLLNWCRLVFFPETPEPPILNSELLHLVVMSMLGLGSYRTVEKLKGRSR